MNDSSYSQSLALLHIRFLQIMPRIVQHARIHFHHRCPHAREDAIAETVALCWKWFLRLTEQGKDPGSFVSALATYAVRHVRCGRKLVGSKVNKDVLSGEMKARYGYTVSPLPSHSSPHGNLFDEALHDNMVTPVPDQVHFRMTMPGWLNSLGERKRRIAEDLMTGERTLDVAVRHGLSNGRISQIRQELKDSWDRLSGEPCKA